MLGAARLLSGYDEAFSVFDDTLSQHRTVEAVKHAYAIRMSLSDPAFFSNVTKAAVDDMMTGPYMEELRKMTLDDDVLSMSGYGGDKWGFFDDGDVSSGAATVTEEGHDNRRLRGNRRRLRAFQYLNDHGTTHLAIIDKDGNAVTMTTTINTYFGSGIVSPSTGIIFNSQVRCSKQKGAMACKCVSLSDSPSLSLSAVFRWTTFRRLASQTTTVWSHRSPTTLFRERNPFHPSRQLWCFGPLIVSM